MERRPADPSGAYRSFSGSTTNYIGPKVALLCAERTGLFQVEIEKRGAG